MDVLVYQENKQCADDTNLMVIPAFVAFKIITAKKPMTMPVSLIVPKNIPALMERTLLPTIVTLHLQIANRLYSVTVLEKIYQKVQSNGSKDGPVVSVSEV